MTRYHQHPHKHPHEKGEHHHHPHRHPHAKAPKPVRDQAHHHALQKKHIPEVSSLATKRIKRLWRKVYKWFPLATNLGIYNRRKISGSSRWSEHAWGDAWDVASPQSVSTGSPDKYLDAIVWFIHSLGRFFRITRVIYRNATHQNHAHVDVDPDHEGTPP